jgi:hypothetical protein
MPVGLFSEEEELGFWINFFGPVGTVGNCSMSMGCLLVSGTISVNMDSLIVSGPFVVVTPVFESVNGHIASVIDSVSSRSSVVHWAW